MKPKQFKGDVEVPGDKSISHRALIFGAIAKGKTEIIGLSEGEDVLSTARCLKAMGVEIEGNIVHGGRLRKPKEPLNCGNSGTTMRLLMGLLAGQRFHAALIGDESLSKRPMERVAKPLREMGAEIETTSGTPPVIVKGKTLRGATYELPIASAQVKSALLLAALFAKGKTAITGKIGSRDHTERMLKYFGANLREVGTALELEGPQKLEGKLIRVPGDPSSAAYWIAGACLVPGGDVRVHNVSLNPTRIAFFEVLKSMGADISYTTTFEGPPEECGTIEAKYSSLQGIEVPEKLVPFLIDEVPLLAVLGAFAKGRTIIRGIEELRHKESDRIEATAENLRKMGAEVKTTQDSIEIEGPQRLTGAVLETFHDHRIAMAFSIAALVAAGETTLRNPAVASVSYPTFYQTLKRLCG